LAAIGPFLIAAFAFSKSSYGLFLSMFSLIGAVTSPAMGAAADRVGGMRLLRWAFYLAVGVSVGLALTPNAAVLFALAMAAGLTASAANPSTNTVIADHLPPARRGISVGIKQAGGPLGIAAAGLVMPPIADRWGWEWAALTGIVIPLIGLGLLGLSRVTPAPVGPRRDRSVPRPAHSTRIRILTANAAAVGVGVGAILGFIAVYGVEEVGMSETAAGAMLSVIGFVGVASRLGWGAVADRVAGSSGLLAAMGIVSAVGVVGMWAAAGVGIWLYVAATTVLGLSAMAWNAVGMLAVIRESEEGRAGVASGYVVFGFLAGFAAGPWAFGTLVDVTGDYTASFLMVLAAFAVSVAVLAIRPQEGRG
jgi:MFS family permease